VASLSFVTDTPDFFRRAHMRYPEHGMRFTGGPAYFHHTLGCARALLDELKLKPSDFRWAVFHQPNPRFPREVAKELGFKQAQIERSLVCKRIGNTYAGSSLLGLAAVLDDVSGRTHLDGELRFRGGKRWLRLRDHGDVASVALQRRPSTSCSTGVTRSPSTPATCTTPGRSVP
jgi:hypothetical protein